MDPKFEDIRAALCLSRGGYERTAKAGVLEAWQALTDDQRRGYLKRYRKLPAPDRAAYLKDLPALPADPEIAEPVPAGDEFAPQPKADDDTTDPDPAPRSESTRPPKPDPADG